MTVIYSEMGEDKRIDNVYQVIYDNMNNFMVMKDKNGSDLGSVNLDKIDDFTVVDFKLSEEKSSRKKRGRFVRRGRIIK